jgi:hypothetical protein
VLTQYFNLIPAGAWWLLGGLAFLLAAWYLWRPQTSTVTAVAPGQARPGDRVAMGPYKGTVMAVSGTLLTVLWDDGIGPESSLAAQVPLKVAPNEARTRPNRAPGALSDGRPAQGAPDVS